MHAYYFQIMPAITSVKGVVALCFEICGHFDISEISKGKKFKVSSF